MSSNSSILITGGSGLLAVNWAIAIRDRWTVFLGTHQREITLKGVESQHVSLETVDSVQQTIDQCRPSVVIHTAGLTNVERCESDPSLARHVNVDLAENVANACALAGVTMVHISTDHLFSGQLPLVEENHAVEPQNMYGRTKAEAEDKVLSIYPDALVVRTNFFGWGASYRQSFSDWIIHNLSGGKPVRLFTDVFYTPILIESLVQAVHGLLMMKESGVFHVTGDERLSKYQFGVHVADEFGFDRELLVADQVVNRPGLVHRPLDMSLSNKKACNVLGRSLGGVAEQVRNLYQQKETTIVEELRKL
ncbi:MAG: NAD(P)-dependent oxidoreductase [Mariprofundales bacterium]